VRAVELMVDQAALEADAQAAGTQLLKAAIVARDHALDPGLAADCLERALDAYFSTDADQREEAMMALATLDAIHTANKDWKALERAYLRVIERLPPHDGLLPRLWKELAKIYRDRLNDTIAADKAQAAADESRETSWADLVISGLTWRPEEVDAAFDLLSAGEAPPKTPAVAAAAAVDGGGGGEPGLFAGMPLEAEAPHAFEITDPLSPDGYRALLEAAIDADDTDRAFCAAQVLVALGKAEPEEHRLYDRHAPRGLIRAKKRLGDLWARVVHPEAGRAIGGVLAMIHRSVALLHGKPRDAYGLNVADRRDVVSDDERFCKIVHYLSLMLDRTPPEVYLFPNQPGEIVTATIADGETLVTAFVVGGRALTRGADKDAAYQVARQLAALRPELFLRTAIPSRVQLEAAFLSALLCAEPDVPVDPAKLSLMKRYLPRVQKDVPDDALPPLREAAARLIAGDTFDVGAWIDGVDATVRRVGLVLCGDVTVAARAVAGEPEPPGSPSAYERLADLFLYCVSDDHAVVRRHLGIAIDD
jgi:hypothetical protein